VRPTPYIDKYVRKEGGVVEVVAIFLFLVLVAGSTVGLYIYLSNLHRNIKQVRERQEYERSLPGQIESKQAALVKQEQEVAYYKQKLRTEQREYRRQILTAYYELAEEKYKKLADDLQALKDQQEDEGFENSMQRRN
jgi:hypothetical protein